METKTKVKIRNPQGALMEVDLDMQMYSDAQRRGISLSQHLTHLYGAQTDEAAFGSVISQVMQNTGLLVGYDHATGLRAPSMKEVLDQGVAMSAITNTDGNDRSPAGRIMFPEILLRTVEAELRESKDDYFQMYERMVAMTQVINGPRFDQPVINVSYPEESASNRISELAEPDAMISITTGNTSRKVPTKSIGLMISEEAMATTTLDLVNIIMTAQARGERYRMVQEQLGAILNGDPDFGEAGLSGYTAKSLDPTIATAGEITHTAWIKFLRRDFRRKSLNFAIADLDTALAIESRKGKPTRDTVYAAGSNFDADMTVDNLNARTIPLFLCDTEVAGANTVVSLDTRYGIRRVINVSANYSAVQEFVLRKARALRIDYAEMAHSLYPEAFEKMTLTI